MDIDRTNFEQAVCILEANLACAEFIVIYCEVSGFDCNEDSWLDSPQDRYDDLKLAVAKYSLVQVGVTLFLDEAGVHSVLPLNFYVFPQGSTGKLTFDMVAVDLSRRIGIDFNKWIYQGIPYVDEQGETTLYNKLFGSSDTSTEIVLTKPRDIQLMRDTAAKIQRWYDSEDREMELSSLNAFHRKYLYQTTLSQFPGVIAKTRETHLRSNS
jgi:hypothetical protein